MAHASRHLAESVFAGIRVFGNWLAGRPLPPAGIAFMHAAPDDCREHERIFGGPVAFGAPAHAARFDATLLTWPVPNADIGLYPVLQQHAEQLLHEKQRAAHDPGIVAEVRAAIMRNLAQNRVRLPLIADELHITQRTLQRKLQEAGVTFQQVLDQTRQALALDYLRQGTLSIAAVAFMLGYQEQSSFNHAFKKWTGVNPGAYRGKSQAVATPDGNVDQNQ
jgi:AraC-like DNA-binding protein